MRPASTSSTAKSLVRLAGIGDLSDYRAAGPPACGGSRIIDLLDGTASRGPWDVFKDTSPAEMLPIGVPQAIISGSLDPLVPAAFGHTYAVEAIAAGDPVQDITIGDVGHFGDMAKVYAVAVICIGAAAHQAWSANLFTTVSDMFPKTAVGSATGIGAMAGGLGGVIVQLIAGTLTDTYKATPQTAYLIMFVICALSYLIAWTGMKLLVPRHKPITDI